LEGDGEGLGFYVQNMGLTVAEDSAQTRATRVFHLPMELPPKRAHDHAIVLKPRAAIPNLRPYKYPYYQNNEIEKIVKEMLHTGIVRHSASLFSSPVLLVKNKRWGWRFCSLH
jgi:hypothetical protein